MSERYTELSRLNGLYAIGCPLIIVAGAILKDNLQQKVLLQLKFRNISTEIVTGCKIRVRAFETDGTAVTGIDSFSYLDLSVPQGNEFGSQVPVYLPDAVTRKVEISIISVSCDNGIWNGALSPLTYIPEQESISTILTPENIKSYSIETGISNCEYIPVRGQGLFLCTCGTINMDNSPQCYGCGKAVDLIFEKLNIEYLTEKTRERKQKEEEELLRREQERIQKEKEEEERRIIKEQEDAKRAEEKKVANRKRRKRIITIAAIGTSFCILVLIFLFVVLPVIKQKKIDNYIGEGNYLAAIELLEKNGQKEKIQSVQNMYVESLVSQEKYQEALKYAEENLVSEETKNEVKRLQSLKSGNYEDLLSAEVGNIVLFGEYDSDGKGKKPIEWRVLDSVDEKKLLITRTGIEEEMIYGDNYENSNIRERLNSFYYEKFFTEEERVLISDNNIESSIVSEDVKIIESKSKIAKTYEVFFDYKKTFYTKDKMFLLSINDVIKYFPKENSRKITDARTFLAKSCVWGLRDSTEREEFWGVNNNGEFIIPNSDMKYYIRPAIWIDIKPQFRLNTDDY